MRDQPEEIAPRWPTPGEMRLVAEYLADQMNLRSAAAKLLTHAVRLERMIAEQVERQRK